MLEAIPQDTNCITQALHQKIKNTWSIRNFSLFSRNEKGFFQSLLFPEHSEVQFILKMYPHGINYETRNYISMYLILAKANSSNIMARCKFGIIDKDGNECNIFNPGTEVVFALQNGWGSNSFIEKEHLMQQRISYLHEDELKIFCEIDIFEQYSAIRTVSGLQIPECKLKENISTMYNDRDFTDIAFLVENKIIPAHKVILASRSPVFSAMFRCDMSEKKQKVIDIKNVKADVFEEMLHFMYSGECPNLFNMSKELLQVSDLFNVERLKALAEQKLIDKIYVENAVELLILADQHSAFHLKKHAMDFFTNRNIEQIVKTEGWMSMMNNQFSLLSEIIGNLGSVLPPAIKRRKITQETTV